jgi:multiple antibiotic resistance protein
MGAAILLMANAKGDLIAESVVIGALLAVILLTLLLLLLATKVQQLLGVTGMHVISRVFGVLLSALAVQFMFDGIAQSGLLQATH